MCTTALNLFLRLCRIAPFNEGNVSGSSFPLSVRTLTQDTLVSVFVSACGGSGGGPGAAEECLESRSVGRYCKVRERMRCSQLLLSLSS